ncbi:hypothetical protein BU23DRAFT_558516 [Bimuria novae-zelandiae CBS 107.79]|uniref:Uncharacterized protein n=1 Tax=Bimuria novae-zelandiae CBS 107.79 TaxID=1447943 RepID=A0A6A5UUS5_9PLEO|nr:hypothetical protein BU23DRAFT_558516 [Bimuria novae-zelandiae CBS 107.79]
MNREHFRLKPYKCAVVIPTCPQECTRKDKLKEHMALKHRRSAKAAQEGADSAAQAAHGEIQLLNDLFNRMISGQTDTAAAIAELAAHATTGQSSGAGPSGQASAAGPSGQPSVARLSGQTSGGDILFHLAAQIWDKPNSDDEDGKDEDVVYDEDADEDGNEDDDELGDGGADEGGA